MLTFDTLALVLILTAVAGEAARFAFWLRWGGLLPAESASDAGAAPELPASEA